jgi:hypothetical protein
MTRFKPMHMSLYPTMDSMVEAVKFIESQIPVHTPNEVFTLLMIYHNTLLKVLAEGNETVH